MSTEPGQVRARSSSPEAERMRLYRKRRQEGMRYVRIPLHVMEVDALIRIGRLEGGTCGQMPKCFRLRVFEPPLSGIRRN